MMTKNPATYRLRPDQDAWLQAEANRKGHGVKVLVLRLVIDRAMRRTGTKPKRAA